MKIPAPMLLQRDRFSLVKIGTPLIHDDAVLDMIVNWRNINRHYFITNTITNRERTKNWLINTCIEPDNSILYLIFDKKIDDFIGHVGISLVKGSTTDLEFHSVLRAVKASYPGLMHDVMRTLMQYMIEQMPNAVLCVNCLETSKNAVDFYLRLNFEIVGFIYLKKIELDSGSKLIEAAENDEKHIKMLRMRYRGACEL